MTVFLIIVGIVILAAVAWLILVGVANKALSGLNPEDWEE